MAGSFRTKPRSVDSPIFPAIAIIAEETTTYSDFIEDKDLLGKFVRVSATLSRQQEMPVTFVAHNNTQTCLGDIKGLANLIARMQQIQLLPTTDPLTSQPVASGKALIRLDGSTEWMEVSTPKIDRKITNFKVSKERDRAPQPVEDSSPDALSKAARQRLEATYKQDTAEDTTAPNVSSNNSDGIRQIRAYPALMTTQWTIQTMRIRRIRIQNGMVSRPKSSS